MIGCRMECGDTTEAATEVQIAECIAEGGPSPESKGEEGSNNPKARHCNNPAYWDHCVVPKAENILTQPD